MDDEARRPSNATNQTIKTEIPLSSCTAPLVRRPVYCTLAARPPPPAVPSAAAGGRGPAIGACLSFVHVDQYSENASQPLQATTELLPRAAMAEKPQPSAQPSVVIDLSKGINHGAQQSCRRGWAGPPAATATAAASAGSRRLRDFIRDPTSFTHVPGAGH